MNRRAHLLLTLCTALGLAASTASAVVHYRLLRDPGYTSFCDVSATISCSQAYLSPWGSLFGVPVALLGVFWFAGAAALLLAGRVGRAPLRDDAPSYLFAWSVVGLAFVLYLAYGAFVVLKAVCVLCILTYVAVAGIFLVSGAASRVPMTTLPRRALRDLRSPVALAVLVLLVAGAASAVAFFPRETPAAASAGADTEAGAQAAAAAGALSQDQRSEVERWFDAQPRAIVPVDPAGARVLIVKFNDYQCPPCGRTFLEYKPILARYESRQPGAVKFVTKDYPIDPECNSNTPNGGHLAACEAAAGVRAARQAQGEASATRLEEWLFANQQRLTPAAVRDAVAEVGGVRDFDARYPALLQEVKSDAALGGLLGVRATPTFFINGVKIDGGLQAQFFDAIIAYELKKAAK